MLSIYENVILALMFNLGLIANIQAYEYTNADIEIAARDYSGISATNRWFARAHGAMDTAWANQWLEFEAYLVPGQWNIGINATNRSNLGNN